MRTMSLVLVLHTTLVSELIACLDQPCGAIVGCLDGAAARWGYQGF
jgi:hypothetical protein